MGHLTSRAVVETLYRIILQREADAEGADHFASMIDAGASPDDVVAALKSSEEFQIKDVSPDLSGLIKTIVDELRRRTRIVDVGAQALQFERHIYAPLLEVAATEVIGFEPLAHRVEELKQAGKSTHVTILPYAIGDGGEHTLYINNDDATSSLFPLNETHNALFNHLSTLVTADRQPVLTHKLDETLPPGPVDFLKIDVQGAELLVLQSAHKTLSNTAVVHCEVEFAAIYAGQPLYPAIQHLLNNHGFNLIDLYTPVRYTYHNNRLVPGRDRLLWADAVFFRDTSDSEVLIQQALIAATIYKKGSLSAYCLERAVG